MEMGVIDNEFVANVLAVDFTNPLFSAPVAHCSSRSQPRVDQTFSLASKPRSRAVRNLLPSSCWTTSPTQSAMQISTASKLPHMPARRERQSQKRRTSGLACWCIDGPKWIGPSFLNIRTTKKF